MSNVKSEPFKTVFPPVMSFVVFYVLFVAYGKCSKISNTLKLRTPKIIAENNF